MSTKAIAKGATRKVGSKVTAHSHQTLRFTIHCFKIQIYYHHRELFFKRIAKPSEVLTPMIKKVIFIPGNGGGSPKDNWFPSIKKDGHFGGDYRKSTFPELSHAVIRNIQAMRE